ncbi:MAG: DUF853 family protein [Kofleriaceae bacterium]|nr:DUF853 family protein [Kofleriaceae bacterium]
MIDYEKLGVFYLGKPYDLGSKTTGAEPYLYDAKDLTTHAICVGMTGSGKTGLCIAMLEEAAIDGVPVLAIDVKGDLANLALTFPQLRGEDFAPWVDSSEAQRRGITNDALGAEAASNWQKGLGDWHQDGARIERLRAAAPVTVYTPGASFGVPLAVLRALTAPSTAQRQDAELVRERASGAVSSLLTLLGVESDPMTGREHVLLATIVQNAWLAGQDLNLPTLIGQIQTPGFTQIGVMNLDTFYPPKDRFGLAMRINTLIASPAFAVWTQGEPMEIAKLLWTPRGQPRISVISVAHLDDAQRMFFVSSLLTEVVSWMRSQNGSSSLRAILYMDEIFGYFPPTATPPSKLPMLTLLKQARAFGLGIMLATQNPVDLDYKGLANCGTWMIGRLQTDRDKQRLLDGLEGAAAVGGTSLDRAALEKMMSALESRVFLVNNVHDNAPVLIKSRFAMSYLPGPLSREQITRLRDGQASRSAPTAAAPFVPVPAAVARTVEPSPGGKFKPALPPAIKEVFVQAKMPAGFGYKPALLAQVQLHFVDSKAGVDSWQNVACILPVGADDPAPDWSNAIVTTAAPTLVATASDAVPFAALGAAAASAASYSGFQTSAKNFLYANRKLTLFRCAALKATSQLGESEGEFRIRLTDAARAARDVSVDKLRKKYAPKVATLEAKIDKATAKVELEQSQAAAQTTDTALSMGAGILGALFGRKVASTANISRVRTAARSASKAAKERGDVLRAKDQAEQLEQALTELQTELETEIAVLQTTIAPSQLILEPLQIAPRKADIAVDALVLAWVPWTTTGPVWA